MSESYLSREYDVRRFTLLVVAWLIGWLSTATVTVLNQFDTPLTALVFALIAIAHVGFRLVCTKCPDCGRYLLDGLLRKSSQGGACLAGCYQGARLRLDTLFTQTSLTFCGCAYMLLFAGVMVYVGSGFELTYSMVAVFGASVLAGISPIWQAYPVWRKSADSRAPEDDILVRNSIALLCAFLVIGVLIPILL